jgi:hypothetical protein
VVEAAAEARRLTGASEVSLVGLRLGAAAVALAAGRLGAAPIVLLFPVLSGCAHAGPRGRRPAKLLIPAQGPRRRPCWYH